MAPPEHERRDISQSQFGDHTVINQGNLHIHLPHLAPRREAETICVIPYPRNENLIYRRDLINKLDELLPETPGFHSAALWGLGGSGKTQIALELAYRRLYDSKYCVFWVHADSEATFTTDYKTIGKRLGVDEKIKGSEVLDAVRRSIEAQSRWLIIIDNADNLELFGVGHSDGTSESLYRYIPQGPQGKVLWTSRDAHIGGTLVGSLQDIKVPPMTRDEATALLATACGDESSVMEPGVIQLLEELQRLPLAVSQAGAYMRRAQMTIKEYIDLLMQGSSRWDLLKMNNFDRHRRPGVSNSVLETWKISTQRIREESELSYRILHVIAYLDGQDVPHELVVAASQYSVEDNKAKPVSDLEVRQAVMRLVEFSFLDMRRAEGSSRRYEMHKLVQEAVRYGLWVQGQMGMPMDSFTASENGPKNEEQYYASISLQIVENLFPQSKRDSWAQCEQYVTHAIRVAEWAEITGREVQTSTLLNRVSTFLYDRGRWREKEPVDQRALSLQQLVLGEKHPNTIRSMANLAIAYHDQGRYNKAEVILKETLDLQQQVLGEEHPDTITSMANLATTYHNQGQYNKAEGIKKQVLDIRQQVLGEKHPDTISSMADLAATYFKQGRYVEDEEILLKVLDLQGQILGETHPNTIPNMAALAATYHKQGRHNEAEELSVKVIDLQRQMLGETHPNTIRSMAALAVTYHEQGRYNKAEEILLKVLDFQRQMLGERHPDTISSIATLGVTYHQQGRYNEAEEISVKVLDLRRQVLGEKHPDTIYSMADLATSYYNQGRYGEAEGIWKRALDLRQQVLGERHPDTISSMEDLAAIYYQQGQYDMAETIHKQTLDLRQQVLGERHPDTISSMAYLAAIYHQQDQYNKAETIYKQTLDLRQQVLGEEHPDTINSMADLAAIYYQQDRYNEAEILSKQALALRRQVLGEKHPDTIQSISDLATIQQEQAQRNKRDLATEP